MPETLKDHETADSFDVTNAPFKKAFNTDLPMWSWFELPENKFRLKTFGQGMKGSADMVSQLSFLNGKLELVEHCLRYLTVYPQASVGKVCQQEASSSMSVVVLDPKQCYWLENSRI